MKKNYIIAFASFALAMVGCSKNEIADPQVADVTVIEVSAPDTKVVIGEDGLAVNWQVGDKIKVNGVESEGLTVEDITSPASARFTFNSTLEAPYYGMYNAARGYDFVTSGNPHCSVNLDTPQIYTEGSFDANAAVFYGKSETASAFALQHAMAYLKITPVAGTAADAKIGYIMLSSRSGQEALAGRFLLSFDNGSMTPINDNSDYVVMKAPTVDGVDLGKPFIIAIPVQEYSTGLRVRIVSVDGKYMDRNLKAFTAVAGKIYPVEAAFNPTGAIPVATATEVSSSTVSFTWGYKGAAATQDIGHAYEFGLYKNAACTDLVVSHKVGANNACWEGRKPKFCFGGLQSDTKYYFKVKDSGTGVESEIVSAETSSFTNVTMPMTAAGAGDTILAEDFSELILGGEFVIAAASACTKLAESEVFKTLSGEFPVCYLAKAGEEKGLTDDAAKSGKRLEKWSYAFNSGSSVYSHVGCVKMGTASNNTWLTTPVLSAIPDGKTAGLEITVTLAAYDDSAVNTAYIYACSINDKASITTARNLIKSERISTAVRKWNTYTVTLTEVDNTMRLAIGPDTDEAKTAKGKGRMVVSDVVVRVKELTDKGYTPSAGTTVYGRVTGSGVGLAGAVVSDGAEVALTDSRGYYELKSAKKRGYVFVSVPSGYEAPLNGVLPRFSNKLVADAVTCERSDFKLIKADDQDNYTMLFFGDMHLTGTSHYGDIPQFRVFANDAMDFVNRNPGKEYALTLGDMTWDIYWATTPFSFPQYLELANSTLAGLPIFHTMGNHDNNYKALSDFSAERDYLDAIGPTYYSFNIGPVHYVVLDDIDCSTYDGTTSRKYTCSLTDEQFSWLRKDLEHVSKTTPLVVTSHSNFFNEIGVAYVTNAYSLVSCFAGFETVHLVTGHTHQCFNIDRLSDGHFFEHNAGSVCATWWLTGLDYPGFCLAKDGSLGGYTIMKINGKDISWQYKATSKDITHQFRSYDRNCIDLSTAPRTSGGVPDATWQKYTANWSGKSTANEVYLNVWNWDPSWKVEVTENGQKLNVSQVTMYDPLHILAYSTHRPEGAFSTSTTRHAFKVVASSASSTLEIRVTDRFGNVYTESMKRPRAFSIDAYNE